MMEKSIETLIGDRRERVAYFSMEIGLDENIPTYCGGLGILAGDTLKSYADFNVPVVGVTLLSEKGFFRQILDKEGNQQEEEVKWNPRDYMTPAKERVSVQIQGRKVYLRAWIHMVKGITGHTIPVLFLDTNISENNKQDRKITWYLYGGDQRYRLKQEIVLGVGGVKILKKLGFKIKKYHMNEGHSSLIGLELLKQEIKEKYRMNEEHSNFIVLELLKHEIKDNLDALEPSLSQKVKDKCVFTTHTPIRAGHDKFSYPLISEVLGDYIDQAFIKRYGGYDNLNMTLLGFNLSKHINGVAKKHGELSRSMFPGYEVHSITNGVHPATWTCEPFKRLYDRHIKDWRMDSSLFRCIVSVPGEEIWAAHTHAKKNLINDLNKEYGLNLSHETLTIGFARRMAEYKRPALLFNDPKRLAKLASKYGGLQIVFSGKAHPRDFRGKGLIKEIFGHMKSLRGTIKSAYIEDYGICAAKKLVSGVDLWLNTPQKPKEASGTSGMKATLNGVLNLSILDGWWIEGHIEGVTGWSIGGLKPYNINDSAKNLYTKLEQVMDVFYQDQSNWIDIMKNAISLNAPFFNSHRMIHQYVVNTYLD